MKTIDQLIEKHRRYSVGEFPDYDRRLARVLSNSFNKLSLVELDELTLRYEDAGDKVIDSFGTLAKDLTRAELVRGVLEQVSLKTKNERRQAINQGKQFNETISAERLEAEAEFDVVQIEKEILNLRIVELEKEQRDSDNQERLRLMRSMPLGSVESINYETGTGHIGYMKVAPLEGDGVVCILDELSPYNGMSVFDFREHVLTPYRLAMKALRDEKVALWKANGKKGPNPSSRRLNPKWPDWPKGVPNYLLKELPTA